ncbi:hypothetical protein A2U01_0057712, partial [Trifolium medium]|nr:hypothetical protein [Trifolium medium]
NTRERKVTEREKLRQLTAAHGSARERCLTVVVAEVAGATTVVVYGDGSGFDEGGVVVCDLEW